MFIERFFNPAIQNTEVVYYNTKDALDHCGKYGTYVRHYSFKGDEYIKYEGGKLFWNDGSSVDKRKLPKNGNGWGKYYNKIHNRCSF